LDSKRRSESGDDKKPPLPFFQRRPRQSILAEGTEFVILSMAALWFVVMFGVYLALAAIVDNQFGRNTRELGDRMAVWLGRQPPGELIDFSDFRRQFVATQAALDLRFNLIRLKEMRSLLDDQPVDPVLRDLECRRNIWTYANLKEGTTRRRQACTIISMAAYEEPSVVLLLNFSVEPREERLHELFVSAAFPMAVFLLVGPVAAYFGLRKALNRFAAMQYPLAAPQGTAQPIDLDAVPREMSLLASAYNKLATQADARLEVERKFIATAAHQLRNPLAGHRLQAEQALQSTDPDAARQALATIRDSAEAAGRLVSQLVSLAKLEDHERLRAGFVGVNPLGVCGEVVERHLAFSRQRNVDLGVEVADDLPFIYGDAALVSELLANLVDNAIRHTPAGGSVTLTAAARQADRVELAVCDSGPGVNLADATRMFQRFVRLAPGGNTGSASGSGLGLTIVQEIAAVHDAIVQVKPAPESGRGLTVAVLFHLYGGHRESKHRP
jgi:signal transduction histidine kinase